MARSDDMTEDDSIAKERYDVNMLDDRTIGNRTDVAIQRFSQERYDESNDILLHLVKNGVNTSFISFCIGRNYLYGNDPRLAREWLNRSLHFEAPFRWTFYELARLDESERDIQSAARNLAKFLDSFVDSATESTLNASHEANILRIAHACFDVDRETGLRDARRTGTIGA